MSEKNQEPEIIYVDAEPLENGYETVPVDSEAHAQYEQQARVYTARGCSPCCGPPIGCLIMLLLGAYLLGKFPALREFLVTTVALAAVILFALALMGRRKV